MAWLDRILAVPAVGIQSEAWFLFPNEIWTLLHDVVTGGRWSGAIVSVPSQTSQVGVHVDRGNGIQLDVDPGSVSCAFGYRVNVQDVAGKFPILQPMPDRVQPYSELLARVVADVETFLRLARNQAERSVLRIGIVADSNSPSEELPPGVAAFVDHVCKPYGSRRIEQHTTSLLVELEKDDPRRDRCLYNIIATESSVRVRLDWQRLWSPSSKLSADDLVEELKACGKSAQSHFEAFGSGEVDYEYSSTEA